MIDAWWNDFVGIPYLPGGADEKGCDCWGLVRLVYRRRFGMELPGVVLDVTPGERPEAAAVAPVLDLARDSFWERVSVPQPGDVAVFRVKGHDSHVGLVTMPGYMLHVREGHDAVIEAYDRRFWKHSFSGVYRWKGMEVLKHLSNPDCVTLIGKPSPFAPRLTKVLAPGATLADIVAAICDEAGIPEPMRKKGVAFVDHEQIPFDRWEGYVPAGGSVVFFRMFPEGSGAGKMIAGIALIVAALVISVYTFGTAAGAALSFGAKLGLGVLSLGLNMAGSFLMNSSMQKSMPGLDGVNVTEQKFLGGGQNRLPKYGVVPQVLGMGRMTLDYLASPYTERVDTYTNYLRAAYTAGYGPVEISDVRNGDTPLDDYADMEYRVYRGDGGDQTPAIFTRDAWEDSPGITLKQWVVNSRQTEPDVDQIQVVLYWPKGLWGRYKSGKHRETHSSGVIRWRSVGGGNWNSPQEHIAERSFLLQPCSPLIDSSLVYDADGNLDSDSFWLSTYGVPKKLVAEEVELELYLWHTFSFDTKTGNIVMRRGGVTDIKGGDPSSRLTQLIAQSRPLWNLSSTSGRLAAPGENEELLYYVCVKGDEVIDVLDRRDSVGVEGCEISIEGLKVTIAEGRRLSAGSATWDFSYKNQERAFTRQFTFNVPRGQYDVEVYLSSADEDISADWDAQVGMQVVWQSLRTFTWRQPFRPRKPLAWLELRAKATDQLNGTLDLINAMVRSVVLDYDYKTKTWVKRASSNPASLFRHVLQGPAMPAEHAVPDERLDLATLERWHEYCRKNGFTYFKVVGGDSGMNVYDLLVEIAAAGRAKPLLRVDSGGMWTVLIDEPKTQVSQLFTEHNSWGWTWTKSAVEPPHAVRATFVDKTKGYEQNTVTVYADGYSSTNATKYENWGVEYFEGITEVENVQRVVRRAIAFSILRCEHLTFYTAQEHLVSEIGDLVMCENSFVQWGLGSGWVEEVLMQDGKAVGLRLSADVTLQPGVEYGLRVRRASQRGASVRYDLKGVSEARQTFEVAFASPLSSGWPEEGDLYQFGYRERESHQCIIESIKPEANGVAQITVCDYAPELIEIDDNPIPPYYPDISTPQPLPSSYIGSVPLFGSSYSDERAIVMEADGGMRFRVAVQWRNPAALERHASRVQLRWAEYSDSGDLGSWMLGEGVELAVGTAYCSPVEEGEYYCIEARYVSASGVVGPWGLMQKKHKVKGRTLPPPEVVGLEASLVDPQGVNLKWNAVEVPDLAHYEVSGAGGALRALNPGAMLPVYGKTGTLAFAVQAVDTLGLKSAKVEATVEVLPPAVPVVEYAILPATGASLVWQDCKESWSIDHYEVFDKISGERSVVKTPVFDISPREVGKDYPFRVVAVDIFGNYGDGGDVTLKVTKIPAPTPKAELDGTQVRIWWPEVAAPWNIVSYEVQTGEGKAIMTVKGTEARFLAPKAGTYNYRVRAIDIAGNKSGWGEYSLKFGAPEAPAVSAALGEDRTSVALAWTMPDAGLPVVAFDLIRQWEVRREDDVVETHEEDYGRFDVQAHAVPALPVGEHSFMVRAVDSSGNIGPWGSKDFTVRAPGAVTPYDCRAVYNNVMLYFTEPSSTFFKVREYLVEEMEGDYPAVVGTVDALFFAEVRPSAGQYTYGITPVDVAGNRGPRATVDVRVGNPPNLVLMHEWESTFNGTRSRLILDGHGSMLGPVPEAESWLENAERVAAELGTTVEGLTWEQKVEADMLTWLSPHSGSAVYVETQDVRELIAAPTIDVTVTQKTLEGDPKMTCRIEVSADGKVWRVAAEDATNVTTENVRFVRLTLTWTGGLVQVQGIYASLNVKSVEDSGTVMCLAEDCLDENGDFLPDEEFGTRVDFNVPFIDVENDVEVKPVGGDTGLNPIVVFTEGAASYPTGFRVALLDVMGQPVDGEVFWYAKGR